MVERFNGRIRELLQQTRLDSRADLEKTPHNYLKLYNHRVPQRASGSKTPIQALKEWQRQKPKLFVKRVHENMGIDIYGLSKTLNPKGKIIAKSPCPGVDAFLDRYRIVV